MRINDQTTELLPFEKKVWLSSPTMHGEELRYVEEAYRTNWMSTIGKNIDEVERICKELTGNRYAVALSCGTAALHLCVKLAGVRPGEYVFCSDMTFAATVNPVTYEGGIPIFIDSERESWNMDPAALERAFTLYPQVKTVVCADLYGVPAKLREIAAVCEKHGAVLIEDAAEAFGATCRGLPAGSFGRYNVISFNGNKIITGSAGGMLLTDDGDAAAMARKWSTQARDTAAWYQHSQTGYNYRMSNVIAGVVRGQLPYLQEHIASKKAIYERYRDGFSCLPVSMNPFDAASTVPNYWLSCLLIDRDAMCEQVRGESTADYRPAHGRSCPTEILDALAACNAEGRPIWKPMHLQPIYSKNPFVPAYEGEDVGADIFARGLCLPSDNKMTFEEQTRIIGIVRSCFA